MRMVADVPLPDLRQARLAPPNACAKRVLRRHVLRLQNPLLFTARPRTALQRPSQRLIGEA